MQRKSCVEAWSHCSVPCQVLSGISFFSSYGRSQCWITTCSLRSTWMGQLLITWRMMRTLDWRAGPLSELRTGQKTDVFRPVIMLLFSRSIIVYLCFLRLCRSQREIRLQCGHA